MLGGVTLWMKGMEGGGEVSGGGGSGGSSGERGG